MGRVCSPVSKVHAELSDERGRALHKHAHSCWIRDRDVGAVFQSNACWLQHQLSQQASKEFTKLIILFRAGASTIVVNASWLREF
jgi:hypothetical protein